MVGNLVVARSRQVTAKISSVTAGALVPFERVPDLDHNNIVAFGIEAFSADELAKSDSQDTAVSASAIKNLTVDLVDHDRNTVISGMPVSNLIRANNGGFIPILDGIPISLRNCRVRINDTTGLSADQVVIFNLYYKKIDE